MRPPHRLLDRKKVHRRTAEHLHAHLQSKDATRTTSAPPLWAPLLAAAARITALSDADPRLTDAPSHDTAPKAPRATRPAYAVLQRQLNAAPAGHRPKALRQHLQRSAIDLTLIPDHGQPSRDLDEIYRGTAKGGPSHFHASATASVVRQGPRPTGALTGVTEGESLKDVVQRRLRQAASVGPRTRLLLGDRGSSVSSGVTCRNSRGRWKRRGRPGLIYASWGPQPPAPEAAFTTYRRRRGIGSSDRQMPEARIRTTSRRPEVRLRDLWVWLHDTILSRPRRGGRVLLLERLRWETPLLWLPHVVEETFGVADITYTESDLPYELAM